MVRQYLLILLLFGFGIEEADDKESECLRRLRFFIGEWELQTRDLQPDGSFKKGQAISSARYILDQTAIQDDFKALDDSGEVIFRGITIRSCRTDSPGYIIIWVMPGREGLTDLRANWEHDRLSGEGKGYDDYGNFLERFEYYHITDSSYSFRMQRSYDNGKTWLKSFSSIEATKTQ